MEENLTTCPWTILSKNRGEVQTFPKVKKETKEPKVKHKVKVTTIVLLKTPKFQVEFHVNIMGEICEKVEQLEKTNLNDELHKVQLKLENTSEEKVLQCNK